MTAPQSDLERAAREAAADRAAHEAAAAVAASYANELAGHRLSRQQQQMADKAARLARFLVRQDAKGGRR